MIQRLRIRKLVLLTVVLIFVVALAVVLTKKLTHGTMLLQISPKSAVVLIDGKASSELLLSLKSGTHSVTVKDQGYITQDRTIVVTGHSVKTVAITLEPLTTIEIAKQTLLNSSLYKNTSIGQTLYLSRAKEFYDGSWIIATVQLKGTSDLALIIFQKDIKTGQLAIYLGPTPQPDQKVINQLPPDLQASLSHDGWLESPACCDAP